MYTFQRANQAFTVVHNILFHFIFIRRPVYISSTNTEFGAIIFHFMQSSLQNLLYSLHILITQKCIPESISVAFFLPCRKKNTV